jgi:hypothetical protein
MPMNAADTMRWLGRSARSRAGAMGHSLKDRALEKRFERTTDEAERLRFENELLRDEVAETRSEHGRILDLLESRLERDAEAEKGRKHHRGRWLLFLGALGAGAYTWFRMRSSRENEDAWGSGTTGSSGDLRAMSGTGASSV